MMKEQNIQSLKQSKACYLAMEKLLGSFFFNTVNKIFLWYSLFNTSLYMYIYISMYVSRCSFNEYLVSSNQRILYKLEWYFWVFFKPLNKAYTSWSISYNCVKEGILTLLWREMFARNWAKIAETAKWSTSLLHLLRLWCAFFSGIFFSHSKRPLCFHHY